MSFSANYQGPTVVYSGGPKGGLLDHTARVLSKRLTAVFGNKSVVEYVSVEKAVEAMEQSGADGSGLLVHNNLLLNRQYLEKTLYDFSTQLTPVALLAETSLHAIFVAHDSPHKSFDELLKANATLSTGTVFGDFQGLISPNTVAMAKLRSQTQDKISLSKFRFPVETFNALKDGKIHAILDGSTAIKNFVGPGRQARLLAVDTDRRLSAHPDAPTFKESGIAPLEMSHWFGAFASASTSSEVIAALNLEINKLSMDYDLKPILEDIAMQPRSLTPAQFKGMLDAQTKTLRNLLAAGLLSPEG